MIKLNRLYEENNGFDKFKVDGTFDKETELEYARQFEWIPPVEAVKVVDVRGHVSNDEIQVKIMFTNSGSIAYVATDRINRLLIDGNLVDPKWFDEYQGNTGSVVGDLLELYKDYQDKKINPGSL